MMRNITAKTLIKAGITIFILFNFARIWLLLGIERSTDAAAGFMMGAIYMASLFIILKCACFLYDEAKEWATEHKMKRNGGFYID